MTKQLPKGTCSLCHGEFSKATMTKHLEACQRRAHEARAEAASRTPGHKTKTFHLLVEGRDLLMYWMHLEVSTGATLADLDQFLRESWLECCGHLSAFEIGKQRYLSHAGMYMDGDPDEKSMRVRLDKVLSPGLKFFHEYDFGTTTELSVKVLAEEAWEAKGQPIQVQARNTPPLIPCGCAANRPPRSALNASTSSYSSYLCYIRNFLTNSKKLQQYSTIYWCESANRGRMRVE